MRVLVTGGHGYVGGRLVQALAADPTFAVTAAGRRPRSLSPHAENAVFDLSDCASLNALCCGQQAVVHLAAMNERDCEQNPENALRCNGLATLALLRAAEFAGISRFVYMSTSKVFGANPTGIIDETSLPRPANHYAITHRLAEDYVLTFNGSDRLQCAVLRLSNAVGAPADPNVDAWTLIANDMCRQAATTGHIALESSGMAWRNFAAMPDVVSAIRHALTMPAEALGDGLFHLGGSRSLRIWDLAERIAHRAELLFARSVKLDRALPKTNENHSLLDWRIGKLQSTGWGPTTSLDDEIDATLRLCRSVFDCPR